MVRGWPVLIQDSEDGVIGCYPLAVGEGRCRAFDLPRRDFRADRPAGVPLQEWPGPLVWNRRNRKRMVEDWR
jgi:hypothetical protein